MIAIPIDPGNQYKKNAAGYGAQAAKGFQSTALSKRVTWHFQGWGRRQSTG